jgi:hypothetical protein
VFCCFEEFFKKIIEDYFMKQKNNVRPDSLAAGFVLAMAGVLGCSVVAIASFKPDAQNVEPFADSDFSPRRLKECAADTASAVQAGKIAPLCRPDLVVQPSYQALNPN